jgi:hypothetical protein
MKKLLGIVVGLLVFAPLIFASNEVIAPQVTGMQPTDTETVKVCVTDRNGNPFEGVDLLVVCEGANSNLNDACDATENGNTAEFDVTVLNDGLTDANGCEDVQLETIGATFQEYVYRIQAGQEGDATGKVAEETGFAVIPEFTTIGATLALAGAGLYIYKRKRQ